MACVKELIGQLQAGVYDETFRKLYADTDSEVEAQRQRYAAAARAFGDLFGAEREVRLYSAPGRTEIGGNHTDHNNGVVMATAVNLDIIAVVAKSEGGVVRVKSQGCLLYTSRCV